MIFLYEYQYLCIYHCKSISKKGLKVKYCISKLALHETHTKAISPSDSVFMHFCPLLITIQINTYSHLVPRACRLFEDTKWLCTKIVWFHLFFYRNSNILQLYILTLNKWILYFAFVNRSLVWHKKCWHPGEGSRPGSLRLLVVSYLLRTSAGVAL